MQEELKAMPVMKSLNEVEQLSGMPYTTLRKLCMAGKVVHIRLGAKYLINWNKFVEYLNTGDEPEEEVKENEWQEKPIVKCACCGKELEAPYGEAQVKYDAPEMDLSIELCQDCLVKVSGNWQEEKIGDIWNQFQKKIKNIF